MVEIELAIKALDNHIQRLDAKLSYLIRSCDESDTDLMWLNQYEKQIVAAKQEIDDVMEERRKLIRLRQMDIVTTAVTVLHDV